MSERALTILEPRDLTELKGVAELFAKSGVFPDAKSMAEAFVKIMAGRELGFGAFASMNGVHIIKGKATYNANLMAAAIKRHPSPKYDYRIKEHSDTVCELEFYQDGELVGPSRFTLDDAKAANLTSNDTWRKYPRNMLFARAMSNGARWYCADVFGAPAYTPEEMGARVNDEGEPLDYVEGEVVNAPVAHQEPQQAPSAVVDVENNAAPAEPPAQPKSDRRIQTDGKAPDTDPAAWLAAPNAVTKLVKWAREDVWGADLLTVPHARNRVAKALGVESFDTLVLDFKGTKQEAADLIRAYKSDDDAAPAQGELVTTAAQNAVDAIAL